MLFYSLDSYGSVGGVSSTFSVNQIGKCIKVTYDEDSSMLTYLDSYGNFQNVIFSTSKTTDNTIGIREIQNLSVEPPKEYIVEFDLNSVLIYNS